MGLLNNSQRSSYVDPNNYGSYQFTSLEDIINQFLVAYVGEEKIIKKVSRVDVAFHAQRAMQELCFDTFKSIKSQEIVLPPSNTMVLPHDYVNYTKISWSDSAGIKHPLYPTSDTSNPFKIKQEDSGDYDFLLTQRTILANGDFSTSNANLKIPTNNIGNTWKQSPFHGSLQGTNLGVSENDTFQGITSGQYEWKHVARLLSTNTPTTRHFALWQEIDVSGIDFITLSAKGISSAAQTGKTAGIVRIGFSTQVDITAQDPAFPTAVNADGYNPNRTNPNRTDFAVSKNMDTTIYDVTNIGDSTINYIEFNAGDDTLSAATLLEDVDVRDLDRVYLLAVSSGGTIDSTATLHSSSAAVSNATSGSNFIDDIVLTFETDYLKLQEDGDSTTWSNYKSTTPSENQDDYQDDTYWPNNQKRYGLDPQHAQVNGSFYIDNLRGLINFSSNISGKTVILDYISDSLGTDEEMQVHKFAEEAMYRWMLHAIASSRIQTQQIVPRLKKEKIAAIRQAKLRLSNIKLEELTQILRGKSKHIKH